MAAPAAPSALHAQLHMQRLGPSLVFLQPVADGGRAAGPSLTVELTSGAVGLAEHSVPLAAEASGAEAVFGVIGILRLLGTCALAVITGAEQVATLRGHPVFLVTRTRVLAAASAFKDDARCAASFKYLALLREALDPADAGRGLFFSHGADLTLTQQRWAAAAADPALAGAPLWRRADARFFWNRHATRPLTEPRMERVGGDGGPEVEVAPPAEVARFVLPVMAGSVQQLAALELAAPAATYAGSLTLIARRSAARGGTRLWRRGADKQGAPANLVETEQLLVLAPAHGGEPVVASFVQVRGSIPLLWSQVPNIKYKPTTAVAPPAAYEPVFDRHARDLLAAYQGVIVVNLAGLHGSEGLLSRAYQAEAVRFAATTPGVGYVDFDFHKECGATRYDRLEKLWARISADVERFGWFQAGGPGGGGRQRGALRVNCIDCLDRTNVVQGWLARKQLERLLEQLGLLTPGSTLPEAFPEVERQFRLAWADHGDDISRQYAGTGALKSGFTRTGKRGAGGLLDDGAKSAVRYLRNNFADGRRQDALDLLGGAYVPSKDKPSPFKPQASPALPFAAALAALAWASLTAWRMALGRREVSVAGVAQSVLLPAALAGAILSALVRNGRSLVNRPLLRPDLTQQW